MTRAVFFDIGDTLVRRPTVGPGKRMADALGLSRQAGRVITHMLFREAFPSPAAVAARLREEFGLSRDVESLVAEIWQSQEREPVEVPGATACVEAVAMVGARVGVISNIWAPYAAGFRRACPAVVPRIVSWHLSYDVGIAKPDHGLYEAALAASGVRADHAVMVGDSFAKDIVPALALGMGAVWVPRPEDAEAEPGAGAMPAGGVRVRDLDEARTVLLAALGSDAAPRACLCATPRHAIGTP